MAEEETEKPDEQQGPAGLRAHLKDLEKDLADMRAAREQEAAELATFRREKAFAAALAEAKVEGVTLGDMGDLPPDQITAALVKAKHGEKEDQRRAQIAEQAKTFGFESVEEYEAVLKAAQERKAAQAAERGTAAAVATSGPGQPPPKPEPTAVGMQAWEAARKRGVPADYAQAEFVSAAAKQFLENEGRSAPGAGGQT